MKGRAGFSLMEALVALAIASLVLTAVFSLQHQFVDGQRRAETILQRAEIQRNALALVRDLNPADVAYSELEARTIPLPPDLTVQWDAELIGDEKPVIGIRQYTGVHTVGLYRLTVTVRRGDQDLSPPLVFTVDRVGWTSPEAAPAT